MERNVVFRVQVDDKVIFSTPVTCHQIKGIILTISNLPKPTSIYFDNQTKGVTQLNLMQQRSTVDNKNGK